MSKISIEIGDFLGFCDLNGVEALQSEQVQQLEEYISQCHEGANAGVPIVTDAIYDRLMEILRKVNPDSELCKYIWEDSTDELEDTDTLIRNNPMYSIQTVKSFDCDELKNYVKRLPVGDFEAHVSVKLNGHGIRCKFSNGNFVQARSRARASAGRDLTNQLAVVLGASDLLHIDGLSDFDMCEVRGEWVLPFCNLARAREFNPDIVSAFTAVSSMGKDSASEEEWGLLRFVAYEFVADGMTFTSKESEYEFLEELGFEVPLYWTIDGLNSDNLVSELETIVADCEDSVAPDEDGENGYDYYTDGLVFTINDYNLFRSLGDDGSHYKFGNIALKVGYWQQDMYHGYIQTIVWMKGKTKLTPVAIVAEDADMIEFKDYGDHPYVLDVKEIANLKDLGVVTASGNRVRRVPLYEPNNLVVLDAYQGNILNFRYGGEAGVVPCFEDGTPLIDGKIQQSMNDESFFDEYDADYVF